MTSTVDPYNIPPTLTRPQLEEWVLFGIMVAGKSADPTWVKLNLLLNHSGDVHHEDTPFSIIGRMIRDGRLLSNLKRHKTGKYTLLNKGFRQAIKLDLNNISLEMLENVHGIGMKTARMILLYSGDPQFRDLVPLDTHILKYLRKLGLDAPLSTPSSRKQYLELEAAFIAEARRQKKSTRDLDTEVWKFYANRPTAERRA